MLVESEQTARHEVIHHNRALGIGSERNSQFPSLFCRSQSAHVPINFSDQLFQRLTPVEGRALALSRLLINCFIVPYTKSQPNDIDAVVLNDHDVLRFVEFKRKYPAVDDTFGLDRGHAALVRWLDITGHTLSNVVLVDPCWNKKISSLHLLEGSAKEQALWLGAHVSPSMFERTELTTTGRDSGMFHHKRWQKKVSVGRYMNLGRGFRPPRLRAFLNGDTNLSIRPQRN